MDNVLDMAPEIRAARDAGRAVVAIESTVFAHGLPHPTNLETAARLDAAVRHEGALPAIVAIIAGRIRIGLDAAELARLAARPDTAKVSRRDLAYVLAAGGYGATTVSGTMIAAAMAGIRVFSTGGIGGVHRGVEETMDVSADLDELARTDVAVVCAGAKAILDLPRTLEYLETKGVPVIGYGTDRFPAFYVRRTALRLDQRCDTPEAIARLLRTKWSLGLAGGVLVCNPIPEPHAMDADVLERATEHAIAAAAAAGVTGKAITPFLLDRIAALTGGESIAANVALLENNARLAARIAVAFAAR
ncbi:MAG: pseudouridine-5'-phosphate glycosidase [Alphaproteobacteria bacterium]|nr:pseudouridine-5'-phosphate glycosidase [Alphaproteobacteria bacterium]